MSEFPASEIHKKLEESERSSKRCQEIIETLPKEKRWTSKFDLYQYEGFWYRLSSLERIMSVQEKFKAQPTDIVLCSMPKTGMTWLKALAFAIVTRKVYASSSSASPLLTSLPHDCVPFLEMELALNGDTHTRDLPLISTHMSYTSLPKSILETPGCKIIYICRDPKDTFVSLWHFFHLKILGGSLDIEGENFFEAEFEKYCQGKIMSGPFWEHVLGYWKASLENTEKVLFLKYEDLKKDTLFYIRRMADFLNRPFSEEEEKSGVPQKLMELTSFSNLRSLEVNKTGKYDGVPGGVVIDNNTFFRKGEVGDWKNYLTKEMAETIDLITKQKFDAFGLTF